MPVNNQLVIQIINDALRCSRGSTLANRLQDALQMVVYVREHEDGGRNCNDMNYVAADHYLQARMNVAAAAEGVPYPIAFVSANVLNLGYDVSKFVLTASGRQDRMRTGPCPVSPYDSGVIQWERIGARHGFRDGRTHAIAQNFRLVESHDTDWTELYGW